MKLFFASLTVALFLAGDAVDGKKVIGGVKISGSDKGGCAELGMNTNCDAGFSVNAKMYDDGSVTGTWQDSGMSNVHIKPNCISFRRKYKAVVGGIVTSSGSNVYPVGSTVVTVVRQDPDKYTFTAPAGDKDCETFDIKQFGKLLEHEGGKVEVKRPAKGSYNLRG